ncbi:UDP-N-acetylmuramate dehydrogenase [Ferrimicrobium sp.]|uniref:UDP-N-acetylmuramate dehydrogenase n=1 Tax=Ferrimicrobium sp. TaxID=2926050 RepID=UPI002629D965|nr:UDP-N-acetylmuramate dehydrogenase [Ferrimicrobium sp.]
MDEELQQTIQKLRADGFFVVEGAPFGARTTYRVGGLAAAGLELSTVEELQHLRDLLVGSEVKIPLFILGRGSNVLVADHGFCGLLITLGAGFSWLKQEGRNVEIGGASPLPVMARRIATLGLGGFTWAVGVPGSMGGAVRMNAGGHGHVLAETLREALLVDLETDAPSAWEPVGALELGYRSSSIRESQVVIAARLELAPGDPSVLAGELSDIVAWRRAHQPGGQNAGSVFMNPSTSPAAQLIEESGLKGYRYRTAMVSAKHANFIQADPQGSADDVFHLMHVVGETVKLRTGVELRSEVRLVGFS